MSEFDVGHIKYFVKVVNTGSISKAAECSFVSQQAVSKGIKRLEDTLGVPLFERHAWGMKLTNYGIEFLKYAEDVLEAASRCEACAKSFKRGAYNTLHVGLSPLCFNERGGTLSVEMLIGFQQKTPETMFYFEELTADSVVESVLRERNEFGIASINKGSDMFDSVQIVSCPTAIVMSKNCKLGATATISYADLAAGEVVLPFNMSNAGIYLSEFYQDIVRCFPMSPLHLNCVNLASLVYSDQALVISSMQHALRTTSDPGVVVKALVNDEGAAIINTVSLFWLKGRVLSPVEQSFVDFIVEMYRNAH